MRLRGVRRPRECDPVGEAYVSARAIVSSAASNGTGLRTIAGEGNMTALELQGDVSDAEVVPESVGRV